MPRIGLDPWLDFILILDRSQLMWTQLFKRKYQANLQDLQR